MVVSRHISPAMVEAAYRVLLVETAMPYAASISNFTDPITGQVDREGLRRADEEADIRNRALVRRALVAAANASKPRGRPEQR